MIKPEKIKKMHEWLLAINHRDALAQEDYETCKEIQQEVDFRITNGTIDHSLMNGFKNYDSEAQQFYGKPKFEYYNGLFKNYVFPET